MIINSIKRFGSSHPRLFYYYPPTVVFSGLFKKFPDFLIIGQQKCGTTSLHHLLAKHQLINPPIGNRKELVYFSHRRFRKSKFWYKGLLGNFVWTDKKFLTFESSPQYLTTPNVYKIVSKTLPNIKIIIMLRNPADRTYSQYQMTCRLGYEHLSFEDAIKAESKRMNEFKQQSNLSELIRDNRLLYLRGGRYIEDLSNWFSVYPSKNIMVIASDDFNKDTLGIYNDVCRFLDIPEPSKDITESIKNTKPKNVGNYKPMKPDTRKMLVEYFKPYNKKLYQFLNRDFGWN